MAALVLTVGAAHGEPLIVAHRGASRDAPENTLPAFRLAWEQKADAIEGDFHLTRDGHIVCLHDRDTAKVAEEKLVARESSLAELRKLDVGRSHAPEFVGTRIPTIAEVFATVPEGGKIFVEVKCGPEMIPALLREVKESGLRTHQVVVISFDAAVIKTLEKKAPRFETAWLSSFRKTKEGAISPSSEEVLETLRAIGADGFSSSQDRIDQAFIREIQNAGFHYHVWTVDHGETAKRFRQWGARSITTNLPGPIRQKLSE